MSSAWCEFSGRGILTDEMKYGLNVAKALQFSQEEGKKRKALQCCILRRD